MSLALPAGVPSSGTSSLTVVMLGETSSRSRTRRAFRIAPTSAWRAARRRRRGSGRRAPEAYRDRRPTARRSTGIAAIHPDDVNEPKHEYGNQDTEPNQGTQPHASRRETIRSAGGARIPFVTADRSCRGASPRLHGGGRRIAIDVITEPHGHRLLCHEHEQQQQEEPRRFGEIAPPLAQQFGEAGTRRM